MDFEMRRFDSWERIVPMFRYNKQMAFFDILVPTVDTVRFGYLLRKLLAVDHSVLYTGETGVGKVGGIVRTCRQTHFTLICFTLIKLFCHRRRVDIRSDVCPSPSCCLLSSGSHSLYIILVYQFGISFPLVVFILGGSRL